MELAGIVDRSAALGTRPEAEGDEVRVILDM